MQATGNIDFNENQEPFSKTSRTVPKPVKENQPSEDQKKAQQEGHHDAIKETIKETDKSTKKLDKLIEEAKTVIYQVRTASFLGLFPTDIVIAKDKVTVIRREFFASEELHTFPIKDIKEASVTHGPLLAHLTLVIEAFHEGPLEIDALWRDQAIRARCIIQGLKICKDENIDLSQYSQQELLTKVEELGKVKEIGKAD